MLIPDRRRRLLGAVCALGAALTCVVLVAIDPDSDIAFTALGILLSTLVFTAWQMFGLPWLLVPPFGWRKRE